MSRNYTRKKYLPNMNYHIFNRGARRKEICHNEYDLRKLRSIIFEEAKKLKMDIDLKYYCILPTHYHLLLKQVNERDIVGFMASIGMRYQHYYRRKYKHHSGRLFESSYKAIHLPTKADVGRVINYILANPLKHGYPKWSFVGPVNVLKL